MASPVFLPSETNGIFDDRLSALPEHIIHKILYFLPGNQSWQCCLLSKTFKQCLSTQPNFSFTIPYGHKRRYRFLKSVDNLFETIYNHKRLPITKLKLYITYVDKPLADLINRWLEIAINNNAPLQEFQLLFSPDSCYKIPDRSFSAKNLSCLRVSGYPERRVSIEYDKHRLIECSSLKTLSLTRVTIESWLIQKLISNCPKLENITLDRLYCPDIDKIFVHGHDKIKQLCIRNCRSYSIEVVNVPNLESIEAWENKFPRVNIIRAPKLKGFKFKIGHEVFHLKRDNYSDGSDSIIVVDPRIEFTPSWFHELKDYISREQSTSLILHDGKEEIKLNMVLIGTKILDCPEIEVHCKQGNVIGTCDLLSKCLMLFRPKIMSIEGSLITNDNKQFVKRVVYSLLRDKEKKSDCHNDCKMKCWWHHLKDIRVTYNKEKPIPDLSKFYDALLFIHKKFFQNTYGVYFSFDWEAEIEDLSSKWHIQEDDETGVESGAIALVMTKAKVSRRIAVRALKAADGDIVSAIMDVIF